MTTTVTTVTVTTVNNVGLAAALGLITTLALIGLLVAKEITAATPGQVSVRWGRTLNIGMIPLLIAFRLITHIMGHTIDLDHQSRRKTGEIGR